MNLRYVAMCFYLNVFVYVWNEYILSLLSSFLLVSFEFGAEPLFSCIFLGSSE